ncbi:MAG: Gfo/Idh/MocA family oxidoreductase [Erysipelotrichaceae bacterium]|nr:Gfo/Idh/MocA family oxidoreductase [Erysipelotrichaceae bacterium]
MYKYGILSTASIVDRYVQGIKESKDGIPYALASRALPPAQKKASALGIDISYGSYDELYNDPDIDIIYIPTINCLHYQNAYDALTHHKHVIVEKPFVMHKEEAENLFKVANDNHCFLMEAQKSVFLPITKKLKEYIEQGVIGEVQYLEFKASFPSRFTYDHWMCDVSAGGGAFYGSATYTIEYLMYLFDEPEFTITGSHIDGPTGSDDVCNFSLTVDNHILVSSTISMSVPLKNELVVYGLDGYIIIPEFWKAHEMSIYKNNELVETIDIPFKSEFVYEVNHINDCLDQGLLISPVMTPEKTIKTVEMVETLQDLWQKER